MSEFSTFLAGKQLVTKDYLGLGDSFPVSFTEDGWGCATDVAQHYGKDVSAWRRSKSTANYLAALIRRGENGKNCENYISSSSLTESDFVLTFKGKSLGGGLTFIHPKLFVHFTRWCDDDFSIWADEVIFDLLSGKTKIVDNTILQQALLESNRLALEAKDAIIASKDYVIASQESDIHSLIASLDSKSIVLIKEVEKEVVKEVMPNIYNMLGAIDFAHFYNIHPTDYTNKIFLVLGALTKLGKDYLVNPGYEHLLSNPINPYNNQVSTRRSVKYLMGSTGAISLLKNKKITLLPRFGVVVDDLSPSEVLNLPEGITFMIDNKSGRRIQPTMADLAKTLSEGLVDVAKGANDVSKIQAEALKAVTQGGVKPVKSSEEDADKEEPPKDYSNVVSIKKSA